MSKKKSSRLHIFKFITRNYWNNYYDQKIVLKKIKVNYSPLIYILLLFFSYYLPLETKLGLCFVKSDS